MRSRILAATLSWLKWAKDVVVVDSGSTDRTLTTIAAYPNVRVFKRRFDTHAKQWRYAVEEIEIATDWILRLDADYQVSDTLLSEFAHLDPNASISAIGLDLSMPFFHRKFCHRPIPPIQFCCERVSLRVGQRTH